MKIKQLVSIILSTLILSSVFVGCGSTENGTSESQATEISASETTDSSEPVEITYMYWGSAMNKVTVEESCKKFMEKHPNIKVKATHVPSDYAVKLAAMVAANEEPDVSFINAYQAFDWADEDKFVNIFEMDEKDPDFSIDDFMPSAVLQYDEGKGFLKIAEQAHAIWYNKDLYPVL